MLCAAAANGDIAALERMALAGADLCASDYDGRTPLHLAAAQGEAAAVDFLMEGGAVPSAVDRFGNTPISEAERQGHTAIAAKLRAAAELAG